MADQRPAPAPPALTAGQAAAAEAFATWLAAPWDGTPFVLSGYAGTGKTFLCRQLLQQVERSGLCWTVVAPTHKAVGVLRQQLADIRSHVGPRTA